MPTIEIISDVSCPWCVIGYRSLSSAISQLGISEQVELSWRPFELNPNMGEEGQDRNEHIQQKYGLNKDQALANRQQLINRGEEVGYEFNFPENGRVYNTFNAHRLIHWAKEYKLQTELKLELFDLFFQSGGDPSSRGGLLKSVEKVGLSVELAKSIIDSDQYSKEVRSEQALSQQQGVTAVPAFIFDNKYMVSGGQPVDVFLNVFKQIATES